MIQGHTVDGSVLLRLKNMMKKRLLAVAEPRYWMVCFDDATLYL